MIITVSGAHSGVGKTKVVERLLKILKGWSALKVTVLHKGVCPTHRDCGACNGLISKFSIVSDKRILGENGKDTQRFKKAGAQQVLWLKARDPEGIKEGLESAISRFKNIRGLIIEGTSILKYIKPDFSIFVKNKNSSLKPSAKEVLNKVDFILTTNKSHG